MVILSPSLDSNILIREHKKKGLQFFCYYNHANGYDEYCHIELWSNLTTEKQWAGFPLTQIANSQHYKVTVNTFHLLPGDYEFTLRFTTAANDTWYWYGKPRNNGRVRIVPRSVFNIVDAPSFASVSRLCFVEKQHVGQVQLCHFRTQIDFNTTTNERSFSLGNVDQSIHQYVAYLRKGSSWLTPVGGESNFDKHNAHEKWQLFLYQDGRYGDIHLWMTLGKNVDCWLSPGCDSTLNLNLIPYKDESAHLLICSTSKKHGIAQLIKVALDYYRKSIKKEEKKGGKSLSQQQKSDVEMLDTLGYCTWNAFGKNVSEKNLYQAMDSLKANSIPVSYMIVDDGWSNVLDNKLASMDMNTDKFPSGLKGTVANLKSEYPHLKHVGVWHALWGYWDGFHSDFMDLYKSVNLKNQKEKDISLLTSPEVFYNDFYEYLHLAGVDFVKVDNQGAFQELIESQDVGVYDLWDRYRIAVIESANKFLEGRVRHCMSLTPYILFEEELFTKRISIFRSSDDYFPDEDDSHPWHIYANAINALLLSQYPVVTDWDMFESDHPFAEYHASSRAISGGPVYITDTPNKHNAELIQKLVGQTRNKEYTLLRSSQVPLPTFETVFGNVMERGDLISLYNTHYEDQQQQSKEVFGYGVCGFWNTGTKDKLGIVSSSMFQLKSLAFLPTVAYVVSGPERGKCMLLEPSGIIDEDEESSISSGRNSPEFLVSSPVLPSSSNYAMSVCVSSLSSSLVSLSHVRTLGILSIACLGLVDKFNGTRCIVSTSITKGKDGFAFYEAFLSHRSNQCGFWIQSSPNACTRKKKPLVVPQRVVVDNQELISNTDWTYNCETGFLCVDMTTVDIDISPCRNDFRIQIYLDFMQQLTK